MNEMNQSNFTDASLVIYFVNLNKLSFVLLQKSNFSSFKFDYLVSISVVGGSLSHTGSLKAVAVS